VTAALEWGTGDWIGAAALLVVPAVAGAVYGSTRRPLIRFVAVQAVVVPLVAALFLGTTIGSWGTGWQAVVFVALPVASFLVCAVLARWTRGRDERGRAPGGP